MARLWLVLLVLLLLWSASASADITSNLTLWYKLDETSGTTADDSTGGTPHDGTLFTSGDWRSGGTCQVNGCLAFTTAQGEQNVLSGASISTLASNTTITIGIWFKATGTPLDQAAVYDLSPIVVDGGFYLGVFWGKIGGGAEQIHVYNWDGNEDRVSQNYTPGTWVHIGLVHGSGTLKLYVNGALISSTASGNTEVVSGHLQIGSSALSSRCGTLCLVDEFRVYSRALNDADMAELYAYGLPVVTNAPNPRRLWLQ